MNLRDCLVRHGIVTSERVCRLPLAQQLFFRNLLHAGDGAGRFKVDPDDLRDTLYRHARDRVSRTHIQHWLAALHTAGLVRLYTGPEGAGYCELLNYGQKDTKRRVIHPAPDDGAFNFAASDPPRAAPPKQEVNRSECESPADEIGLNPRRSAAHTHTSKKSETIEQAKARLAAAFPDVDLEAELARATAYVRRIRGNGAKLTVDFFENKWLPKAGGPNLSATAPIATIPPEPEYWREYLNSEHEGSKYARGGSDEGTAWNDLPTHVRELCLAKLPAWLRATGRANRPAA